LTDCGSTRRRQIVQDVTALLAEGGHGSEDPFDELTARLTLRAPADVQFLTQHLILTYGRLVRYWPRLLAASRSLLDRGIRLARPFLTTNAQEQSEERYVPQR